MAHSGAVQPQRDRPDPDPGPRSRRARPPDELASAVRPHVTGETYLNFLTRLRDARACPGGVLADADWSRLVRLKDRYDPDNLFRFNRNIPPTTEGAPR